MTSTDIPEKITQIQCSQCNAGLQAQFLQWISESFKYKPSLLALIQDEIQALLNYAQYKLTIAQDKPQPGDFLQNIQFISINKSTKILWLLLSVVVPYLFKKIKTYAAKQEHNAWKTIENLLIKTQKIVSILSFINYAVFIMKGQYRCLVQRVLGIKMRFIDPQNKRILNFSLMNRILVWKVYQFFLKNILPHAFAFFNGPLKNLFYISSFMGPDQTEETKNCVFCASPTPIMPYQARPCKHKACFYCRQSNEVQQCPKCSTNIQAWMSSVK